MASASRILGSSGGSDPSMHQLRMALRSYCITARPVCNSLGFLGHCSASLIIHCCVHVVIGTLSGRERLSTSPCCMRSNGCSQTTATAASRHASLNNAILPGNNVLPRQQHLLEQRETEPGEPRISQERRGTLPPPRHRPPSRPRLRSGRRVHVSFGLPGPSRLSASLQAPSPRRILQTPAHLPAKCVHYRTIVRRSN